MKRYRVTLLIPLTQEIIAADAQQANNEAVRRAKIDGTADGAPKATIHSVEYLRDEPESNFDFDPVA